MRRYFPDSPQRFNQKGFRLKRMVIMQATAQWIVLWLMGIYLLQVSQIAFIFGRVGWGRATRQNWAMLSSCGKIISIPLTRQRLSRSMPPKRRLEVWQCSTCSAARWPRWRVRNRTQDAARLLLMRGYSPPDFFAASARALFSRRVKCCW